VGKRGGNRSVEIGFFKDGCHTVEIEIVEEKIGLDLLVHILCTSSFCKELFQYTLYWIMLFIVYTSHLLTQMINNCTQLWTLLTEKFLFHGEF